MQALELVVGVSSERVDGGDGEGVMARKLRIHRIGRREHRPGAGEIGNVGMHLAREYRIAVEPVDLRALDLAVPIRSLHQTDHHPAAITPRDIDDPVDHRASAFLIRLHDKAEPVPSDQCGIGRQALEQVERELEPIGFLGVEVEPDVAPSRALRQMEKPRQQLGKNAFALQA